MDPVPRGLYRLYWGRLEEDDYWVDGHCKRTHATMRRLENFEIRCPLDNGRHDGQPKYSAGRLDLLPGELITNVLLALDLPSLTTFRRVNRRAMSLVDSLRQYRMILEHCPDVLRAIISFEAKHFDCMTLFQTLSTAKCETCDRFGCHIYFITCKRVCDLCVKTHDSYLPFSTTAATQYFRLPRKDIECLPQAFSRGYSSYSGGTRRRVTLLDRQALRSRASVVPSQEWDFSLAQLDRRNNHRRYMAIIPAPHLTSSGRSADWGSYCKECVKGRWLPDYYCAKYTVDGLKDHLRIAHGL